MKKMSILFLIIYFLITINAVDSYALDGKALFRNKCKACHGKNKVPSIAPSKYASCQWERFINKKKHDRKKNISLIISDEELIAIKYYLIKYAADSDKPEALGFQ